MRFLLSIIFILFFIRFEIVIFIFEIYFPAPIVQEAATRDYHYSAAYV